MTPEWDDSEEELLSYKVLSAQEAKELQEKQPVIIWWKVLTFQLLAGFVVILFSMIWHKYPGTVFCSVAGVMASWIPSVLVTGWYLLRRGKLVPAVFLTELYFIEFIKIVLTITLLVMIFLWVKPLVWPSLLAGFVVTVKAYVIACWLSLSKP